jgi:seryl-tRNA synthetase
MLAAIDLERGAKVSGSRFYFLTGIGAQLEFALINMAMDQARANGFTQVVAPSLVKPRAMEGTGFLGQAADDVYRIEGEDLYLVGTSEVPLASLHGGEVLDAERLPLRYAGFSTCFRREAGAAGKDTRGIFRVHQFDKVELFSFVEPPGSSDEHELLLAIQEGILQELEIPYRVVNIGVSDLGASAAKKYDCEAWLPGQGRYRELTSCSNTTDFQARRLDIRYRPPGGRPEAVHTLNGTAVAVGRTTIALLENGQRDGGGVDLPPVLGGYGAPRALAPRG